MKHRRRWSQCQRIVRTQGADHKTGGVNDACFQFQNRSLGGTRIACRAWQSRCSAGPGDRAACVGQFSSFFAHGGGGTHRSDVAKGFATDAHPAGLNVTATSPRVTAH